MGSSRPSVRMKTIKISQRKNFYRRSSRDPYSTGMGLEKWQRSVIKKAFTFPGKLSFAVQQIARSSAKKPFQLHHHQIWGTSMTRSSTTKETKINPIKTIHRKTFLPSLFGLTFPPEIMNHQHNQYLLFQ